MSDREPDLGDAEGLGYVSIDEHDGLIEVSLDVSSDVNSFPVHVEQDPDPAVYVLARVDHEDVEQFVGGDDS